MKNTKKLARLECAEKFIKISTVSLVGDRAQDPLGEEFYFDLNVDIKTLGDAVVKSLTKSRDLSISDEGLKELDGLNLGSFMAEHQWILERYPERKLFDNELCAERYDEFVKETIKRCKTKTKAATFRNMQSIDIEMDSANIKISSWLHEKSDGWTLDDPNNNITIPSTSSLEVIGAAVKYAIGNCRWKGSDLIRSLLFPDGQPETFEKYIQELWIE